MKSAISISMVAAGMVLLAAPGWADRALFYESFEDADTRAEGILPSGIERIRYRGRLLASEIEIEAPAKDGDTRPVARFVPDPTGLSLAVLRLEDASTDPGDGTFGADGGMSLLESILLDQGDLSGKAVVSWMAVPYQENEPGGAMFPETDTIVDAGPEGLNLLSFGGVYREFDTGNPIPGMDFSGRITINQEGGATIDDLGAGYRANLPTFFVLVFDLERSVYDVYINGIKLQESLPFFEIGGAAGQTLRELELISSARGLGTFAYDNVFQFDPDAPYQPIAFRPPVVAEDADLIPLFMEDFDDNLLGTLPAETNGDLYGTRLVTTGTVHVVEDTSYQSLARGWLAATSTFGFHISKQKPFSNEIRLSFSLTPRAGSQLQLKAAKGETILDLKADGLLSLDANGDGMAEDTAIALFSDLPHWFVVTFNTGQKTYHVTLYRASSATVADTAQFDAEGQWNGDLDLSGFSFQSLAGEAGIDNLLLVSVNSNPQGQEENRYRAVIHESFETYVPGTVDPAPHFSGTVAADPTGWSGNVLETSSAAKITLGENNLHLIRTARIAWAAIPRQDNVECGRLTLSGKAGEATYERIVTGFMENGFLGVDTDLDGILEATDIPYQSGRRYSFRLDLDMERAEWRLYLNGKPEAVAEGHLYPGAKENFQPGTTLQGGKLGGNPGGVILYDDIRLVSDIQGGLFEPHPFTPPVASPGSRLLFVEDFENNPARSEQRIDEWDPRASGLPIETRSPGFSNKSETDLEGTDLWIGAPSAEAAYVEAPDGHSLYALLIADRFAPQELARFEQAVVLNPISTLRTVPYGFVVPELAAPADPSYLSLRWSASALQDDQTGLALFLSARETDVPLARGSIRVPAPAGPPIVAFGNQGVILADLNGDGILDVTAIPYVPGQMFQFRVDIDQPQGMYELFINQERITGPVPLNLGDAALMEGRRFGWFTTLVHTGDGAALQQATDGGGRYVIDDIRLIGADQSTGLEDFRLH
ncbi:MAG: hypothetical protein HPY51_03195 [Candidatus Omnitrophica bacterium]|nr:hypothetical protein [Candidatus Omnitrophota bacterium]